MKRKIELLIPKLGEYLDGTISAAELEQYTMNLISDDQFDNVDDKIQDIIYAIDNKELNELSKNDIAILQSQLKDFLQDNYGGDLNSSDS